MTSEIIDIFDVQIEAPEQFDVVVEQTEVNLEPLTITENGIYTPQGSATGFSKVEANVLPKSTDIVITENGEYEPNDYDVDAFSKVGVDVKPKLEQITATDNGTYTPSEGFDGFGKVEVNLNGKLKLGTLSNAVTNICINENGEWENGRLIDWSALRGVSGAWGSPTNLTKFDYPFMDTSNITNFELCFRRCTNLRYLDIRGWDFGSVTRDGYIHMFHENYALYSAIGDKTLEDVENGEVTIFDNAKTTTGFYHLSGIQYASILAGALGVADLSDSETAKSYVISKTAWNAMYNDDHKTPSADIITERQNTITAILTSKNWTLTLY